MIFADMFADADGSEIEVGGRTLWQVWRDELTCSRLRLDRISATTSRRQGLVLDADVDLSVEGRAARRLVLWADSSPTSVEVEFDGPTEIRIWNVWSDGGMTHAWVGWASIHVETDGETDGELTTLVCYDGHERGDDDPADLVIALTPIAD